MLQQFPVLNGREIHVRSWSPEGGETVVCWHGLARNSIDFVSLGNHLEQKGYRVLAPDTIGRGLSEWAENAEQEYSYANYMELAVKLLDFYNCEDVHWVGTSMGGLIGLLLASSKEYGHRIKSLVLNDIGPEVPDQALKRIVNYVSTPISFHTYSEFNQYLQTLYQPFGPHTAEHWQLMVSASARRLENGHFTTHHDPKILAAFDPEGPPLDLWKQFGDLEKPLMLMHGLRSDVLTHEIVAKMRAMKPKMAVNYYLGCGHAPNLFFKSYAADVVSFIDSHRTAGNYTQAT